MHSQLPAIDPWQVDYSALAHPAPSKRHDYGLVGAPKIVVTLPTVRGPVLGSGTLAIMAFLSGGSYAASTSPVAATPMADPFLQATFAGGVRRKQEVAASERLADVRLRLGLTWAQVASVFDVSRRAVHAWASGEKLNARHEAKLRDLHAKVVGPTDLSALKRELLSDAPAAREHDFVMKGAILSSDEVGISAPPASRTRRVSTGQLRRR